MIAALFVDTHGPYYSREGVDFWTKVRDARDYEGPHPVVAHPPCERWGRYAKGGPSAKRKRHVGDDKGCFWAALSAVRQFGGVLEHPEASKAFKMFGLPIPEWKGGWSEPDLYGGRSCCVAQGHYGHASRKMTWLYAVRHHPPIEERFWNKTDKRGPDECWPWKGSTNEWGYGQFYQDQERIKAHRWSYKNFVGPIPEGKLVRHTCDNPRCVNHAHLIVGTSQDNSNDAVERGRMSKGDRQLCEDKKKAMILMLKLCIPQRKIAEVLDISPKTVRMYAAEESGEDNAAE